MIELVISSGGAATCLYTEDLDFARLGEVQIHRASFVEPDAQGRWWADMSPASGPKLGPFTKRSAALAAEALWLRRHVLRVIEVEEVLCVDS